MSGVNKKNVAEKLHWRGQFKGNKINEFINALMFDCFSTIKSYFKKDPKNIAMNPAYTLGILADVFRISDILTDPLGLYKTQLQKKKTISKILEGHSGASKSFVDGYIKRYCKKADLYKKLTR